MTTGVEDPPTAAVAATPSWGWAIGSATLAVGLVAFFFPVAPLWTLLALVVVTLVLRLTPIGARWVQTERSALLTGLVGHPFIVRHATLVATALFVVPLLLLPGLAWGLSDPADRWNGGVLWIVAVYGFLVFTVVQELRHAGRRARWWPWWLGLATLAASFFLVGGPARLRWAYCESRLTDVVTAGDDVTMENTGRFCWHDAEQVVVDGQTRLYTEVDEDDALEGKGLVFSPDAAIERSGGISLLIDLGGGWYWFETGSPLRNFWFDG